MLCHHEAHSDNLCGNFVAIAHLENQLWAFLLRADWVRKKMTSWKQFMCCWPSNRKITSANGIFLSSKSDIDVVIFIATLGTINFPPLLFSSYVLQFESPLSKWKGRIKLDFYYFSLVRENERADADVSRREGISDPKFKIWEMISSSWSDTVFSVSKQCNNMCFYFFLAEWLFYFVPLSHVSL